MTRDDPSTSERTATTDDAVNTEAVDTHRTRGDRFDRRNFLRLLGVGAATTGLTASVPVASAKQVNGGSSESQSTSRYVAALVAGSPPQSEETSETLDVRRRVIRYVVGTTTRPVVTEGDGASLDSRIADCVDSDPIRIESDGTVSVTFSVAEGCVQTLSLVVYELSEAGLALSLEDGFLLDSDTGTFESGEHSLTAVLRGERVVPGFETVESDDSFDATVDRLTSAIEDGPFTLVTTVDHAQSAADEDLELRPTTLLVFGNPAVGTRLMQEAQTVGIDLPQKLLVWEDAVGQVHVGYNRPTYLAARHGITGQAETLDQIVQALRGLATGESA
ncbi:DUF302 domain-containing protein [Haloprofundus salilacus]|uniref:DUF302 domain-containing protein n=1 Tax=Haloprofundus salilacus TaxID=2876190 RepID=UPI001CD03483|nr:DUF302 domain-containing protein [Haloprofundus salilacus]